MLYIHVQQVSNPRNAFERRGGRQREELCKEAEVVGFALSFMVMTMMRIMTHIDFFRIILPVQSMLPTDRKALSQVLARSPLQSAFHCICLPLL